MRAARYYGPGDVRIEDVDEPQPGPGEVKLRCLFNGLCGTDLHQYFSGPMSEAPLPIIVGHEFSGVVVDVGPGVAVDRVGQLVAVEPIWRCGTCPSCVLGYYNQCTVGHWHGLSGQGGGLSDYTIVRDEMAYAVPDGISAADAALVEPLAVAYHAFELSQATPADRVLVFGGGPIGIGVFLGLRANGIDDVIMVEPAPERRAALVALGAGTVLDPSDGGVVPLVLEATGGLGASVVIDAAGTGPSFADAMGAAAARARVVLVAAYVQPVELNPTALLQREVEIRLSFAYRGTFPAVIGHLAAGRYPTAGWVEHIAFDQLGDAYHRLRRREAVKLLVQL